MRIEFWFLALSEARGGLGSMNGGGGNGTGSGLVGLRWDEFLRRRRQKTISGITINKDPTTPAMRTMMMEIRGGGGEVRLVGLETFLPYDKL